MADFGLVLDEVFKRHDTGHGHPERPARLDAVRAGLEKNGLVAAAQLIPPTRVSDSLVRQVHDSAYIERLQRACTAGRPFIDTPDSAIGQESFETARLAAGAVRDAARRVALGELGAAFCAVRPPGHHAERDRSMGFCLLNNVALAVEAARAAAGFSRIAILDWDVHHGNGTQHIFERDPGVLFISLHGHPASLYPGTGFEDEVGIGAGEGFTLNVPLSPGAGDAEYRRAFDELVAPKVESFKPELILVSAGFDAHADDPLGNLALSDETYLYLSKEVVRLAARHCESRVVSILEGGYNLGVLQRCVANHVRILMGDS